MTAPPRITNNILTATSEPSLLDRLKAMLNDAQRADIAVGYLFLSGFHQVAADLAQRERVRILVGRTDRPTLEAIAAGLQQAEALRAEVDAHAVVRRSEREVHAAQAVRTIGDAVSRLPQRDEVERDVRLLRDMIAAGTLEVKTYPTGLLHAKAYICWYPSGRDAVGSAIVGSSNFTLAGFTGNTELNVRVQNDHDVVALGEWFEALWRDSVDVTAAVLVELDRSWPLAATPPYHVYLKVLYELYHDELGLPPVEPAKRGTELANFQMDAVRRGLAMIDRHGGCFIGDVVGLGKTYVGAELVRQLQLTEPAGRNPLIVCPAGLIPLWERFNERFGLGAAVVSMSAIRPPDAAQFDDEAGEYVEPESDEPGINLVDRFPHRGVVLVDEVHNFRNPGARRYRALYEYLTSGDHKVVLLSATPQNLGPRDVYHQLRLFLDEVNHGLNLEPVRLEEYFAAVQRWYEYNAELENWKLDYERWQLEGRRPGGRRVAPPVTPRPPDAPYATIDQVLNPVFVRRRRKDIQDLYGDGAEIDGRPVRFPTPDLSNLHYRLDKVYARAFPFAELQRRLAAHTGARYRAVDYLAPEARLKPEYSDLLRARTRVATLTRFLLVKRLESSVAAFRATLQTLMRSNRNFGTALKQGFVPIGKTATGALSGHSFDADDLLAQLLQEEGRRSVRGAKRPTMVHATSDFDMERWLADLEADFTVLSSLAGHVDSIAPADDDKLQRLKEFLAQPDVATGKVLIFSEAEATIDYLYEQLNPNGTDSAIARLSGANRDSMQGIIKRFAPTSNLRPREKMPGPPVRVLLATDVVSEGQNLQDCNRVLNYDLHWNPVRMIQRFGRVDRIGTRHETIYLHNTWPDTEVDKELTLTERLLNRIQAFHDMIGLDNRLLSEQERINPKGMYAIYEQRRLPDAEEDPLDDVAAHQRGVALLQQLEQTNPDLWTLLTTLPDGIRSAVALPPAERETGFERVAPEALFGAVQIPLTSPREEAGVQSPMDAPQAGETLVLLEQDSVTMAYAVGEAMEPRHITPTQLVRAVACDPDTPAVPLPARTNQRVMATFERAKDEMGSRLGKARRPTSDTRLRRYLSKQFHLLRQRYGDNDAELKRIGVLQQVFLSDLPARAVEVLNEMRRMEIAGDALLRRLEALRALHRLNPPQDDDSPAGQDPGVLRVVCSDGLT